MALGDPVANGAGPVSPPPASRALKAAKLVLTLLVIWFIAATIAKLARDYRPGVIEWNVLPLVLSTLAMVGSNWVQALGWRALLERMADLHIPALPAFRLHATSQVVRYAPGKVAMPLVRMAGAPRLGVPVALVASSVGIEILSWVAVGWFWGLVFLVSTGGLRGSVLQRFGPLPLVSLGLALVFLLALTFIDRRRWPKVLLRIIRSQGEGPLVPARLLLLQTVAWAGWLLHGGLLTLGVGGTASAALMTSGAYVLAPIVGFLALVTPGGLGVREAMMSLLLAPHLGASVALIATLLARGVTVVADVMTWLLARWLDRGKGRQASG